ncbi:MAG: dimethylarginine dimethylaminohydrolase family protein [Candidatus Hydrothermarchaeota archaeon]
MVKEIKIQDPFARLKKVITSPPLYLRPEPIDEISSKWSRIGDFDKNLALEQYENFVDTLKSEGVKVKILEPSPVKWNQTFVRDVGFSLKNGVIIGRMKEHGRMGEEDLLMKFLKLIDIPVIHRVERGFLEGGDILFINEKVFIGHGNRTDHEGIREIKDFLGDLEIDTIHLKKEFVHLDLAMNVVDDSTILMFPNAFHAEIKISDWNTILASEKEYLTIPANVLLLREGKVIASEENHLTNKLLEKEGIDVVRVEINEILKAGGGPRCLTFPIY